MTTTGQGTTNYYATYQNCGPIYGVGKTTDEAEAVAAEWLDPQDDNQNEDAPASSHPILTAEITEALYTAVQARGGDVGYDRLGDGRLGTDDEARAEQPGE